MAKVKIQGHASGTGILTVTAPNTSTDRTITLPDGDVTLGAATPSITDNGNATAITIDASENVGIGTASPATLLHLEASSSKLRVEETSGSYVELEAGGAAAYVSSKASHPLVFKPGGTEKVRFPSTGGITFNGDSAAANALDDYEEGTFTPSLRGSSTSGNHTYHGRNGSYTKVGRAVHFRGDIHLNVIGTISGEIYVTGLPFTVGSNGTGCGITFSYAGGLQLSVVSSPVGYTDPSTTEFVIRVFDIVGGSTNLNQSELSSGCQVVFSGTYFI